MPLYSLLSLAGQIWSPGLFAPVTSFVYVCIQLLTLSLLVSHVLIRFALDYLTSFIFHMFSLLYYPFDYFCLAFTYTGRKDSCSTLQVALILLVKSLLCDCGLNQHITLSVSVGIIKVVLPC